MYSIEPPCLSACVCLCSVAGAAAHRPVEGQDRSSCTYYSVNNMLIIITNYNYLQ